MHGLGLRAVSPRLAFVYSAVAGETSTARDRDPMEEQRRKTNPLFGDRKLKLGTFGQNLDRGCAISTIEGVLEINWPNTVAIAKIADEMEFEALVPVG